MEWIDVNDQAPPTDRHVLCWVPPGNGEKVGGVPLYGPPVGPSIGYGWRRNVTHRMPVSGPPKRGNKEGL